MGLLSTLGPVALLCGGLGVAGAASYLIASEGVSYFAVQGSESVRFETLAQRDLVPGPSLVAKKLSLDACYSAIHSLYGMAQPSDRRNLLLEKCRTTVADVTESTPSYSYGWYVAAVVADDLHETAAFNAALARSQVTGPSEGWVGQLRVKLAARRFDQIDSAVREGNDRDLKMLVLSIDGVGAVAQVYVDTPGVREHIASIVDGTDDDSKRRFLAAVRHAAAPS